MTIALAREQLSLYQPEKYPVIEGKPSHIALCTCWSDTETLLHKHDMIKEHISIIGTLYSQEGISILLRNLLLNPKIQYVLVWRKSPLSNTEIGKKAWTALFQLWNHGIASDHTIVGTNTLVHKEIDISCITEITKKVKLIDVYDKEITEIIGLLEQQQFPYKDILREKYTFPEPVRDTKKTLPSEDVGFIARENSLFLTWLRVVDYILSYGKIKKTEYGSQQKELQHITWIIEEEIGHSLFPEIHQSIAEKIGLNEKALENYSAYFLSPEKKEGVSYTYGERLRNYHGIDQIAKMIEKLRKNRFTRRAIAITFDPIKDYESSSPPCLNHLQVIIDEKVNLFATFRSHDIFKAGLTNAFGLLAVQDYIAKELGLEKGVLCITSHSAHIYEEEWKDAKDLVMCQLQEKISARFNEKTDLDPRGIVKIQVLNKKIHATLLSYQGEELLTLTGKTCREIIMKIAKLHLLSRNDHYCDITIELMKAEIALNMNLPYKQDQILATPLFSVR